MLKNRKVIADMVDEFRSVYKYYRCNNPPPDLSKPLRIEPGQHGVQQLTAQHTAAGSSSSCGRLGLLPVGRWTVLTLKEHPGLVVIRNPFTNAGQRLWITKCLLEYPDCPNVNNINSTTNNTGYDASPTNSSGDHSKGTASGTGYTTDTTNTTNNVIGTTMNAIVKNISNDKQLTDQTKDGSLTDHNTCTISCPDESLPRLEDTNSCADVRLKTSQNNSVGCIYNESDLTQTNLLHENASIYPKIQQNNAKTADNHSKRKTNFEDVEHDPDTIEDSGTPKNISVTTRDYLDLPEKVSNGNTAAAAGTRPPSVTSEPRPPSVTSEPRPLPVTPQHSGTGKDAVAETSSEDSWWHRVQESGGVGSKLCRQLRWATLGYHYNWSTKLYSPDYHTAMPPCLALLTQTLARGLTCFLPPSEPGGAPSAAAGGGPASYGTTFDAVGITSEQLRAFTAQAAIVNYYHPGTYLGPHVDESEPNKEAPLFSISLGQSCVFLMGGVTKATPPTAMLLQSGDVVVLGGATRLVYHAVPRVFAQGEEPWGGNGCGEDDADLSTEKMCSDDGGSSGYDDGGGGSSDEAQKVEVHRAKDDEVMSENNSLEEILLDTDNEQNLRIDATKSTASSDDSNRKDPCNKTKKLSASKDRFSSNKRAKFDSASNELLRVDETLLRGYDWSSLREYARKFRLNMNVRQVCQTGQNSL